jgi:hypothetical protein
MCPAKGPHQSRLRCASPCQLPRRGSERQLNFWTIVSFPCGEGGQRPDGGSLPATLLAARLFQRLPVLVGHHLAWRNT